jgi:hypothetical protein
MGKPPRRDHPNKDSVRRQRIIAVLTEADKPLGSDEIAVKAELDPPLAYATLCRMRKEGSIVYVSKGIYALSGREPVDKPPRWAPPNKSVALRQRIVAILAEAGKPLRSADVAMKAEIELKSAHTFLYRMWEDGDITRVDHGLHAVHGLEPPCLDNIAAE